MLRNHMFFFITQWNTHILYFFFFNDTATTEIYTLSLHDALPIWGSHAGRMFHRQFPSRKRLCSPLHSGQRQISRSEEHTSELQSPDHLVCRLLLEKKKTTYFHFKIYICAQVDVRTLLTNSRPL